MHKRLTEEEILKIAKLYREGYGDTRICKMIGRTRNPVRNVIRGRNPKAVKLLGGPLSDGGRRPRSELVYWEGVRR